MPESAEYASLPFSAAIDAFRQRVPMPSERWTDLWRDMHARGFVVAGATREALLGDIRQAVDKAVSQGTTLAEFSKDFASICARNGWEPKGGQDWRARVIYETNLSTSYAAGNYALLSDPDVRASRPYLRYVRSSSERPRVEHLAWVGTVLPIDDPWWRTHYPPNGWGCKCGAVGCSESELQQLLGEAERQRDAGEDVMTPVRTEAPADGTYEWTDKRTGEVHQVPKGIDPGWDYNPGRAAWGERQSQEVMDAWAAGGEQRWEPIGTGDWQSAGRPAEIPQDNPRAQFGPAAATREELTAQLKELLGGNQEVFTFETQNGFRHDLVVNAEVLGSHIDLARAPYLPFLRETIQDPYEVWAAFERDRATGQVRLSTRYIKRMELRDKEGMLLVAQASKGCLEAWTMLPVSSLGYLGRQRRGALMWGRP